MRVLLCRYCSYSTKSHVATATMKHHLMRLHLNYRPYSCSLCDYTTALPYNMRHHIRLKHRIVQDIDQNYSCHVDDAMDSKLKNGYVVYHPDTSSKMDRLLLQDHTYNSVSSHGKHSPAASKKPSVSSESSTRNATSFVGSTATASRNVQNINAIGSPGKNPVTALVTYSLSADCGSLKFVPHYSYRCKQCSYVARSNRGLKMHVTKKHQRTSNLRKPRSFLNTVKCGGGIIGEQKLKCEYCNAFSNYRSVLAIHWFRNHKHLPFKFQRICSYEELTHSTAANVSMPEFADDESTLTGFLRTPYESDKNDLAPTTETEFLRTSVELDKNNLSHATGGDCPSSNNVGAISASQETVHEMSLGTVNDVTYCCETCP